MSSVNWAELAKKNVPAPREIPKIELVPLETKAEENKQKKLVAELSELEHQLRTTEAALLPLNLKVETILQSLGEKESISELSSEKKELYRKADPSKLPMYQLALHYILKADVIDAEIKSYQQQLDDLRDASPNEAQSMDVKWFQRYSACYAALLGEQDKLSPSHESFAKKVTALFKVITTKVQALQAFSKEFSPIFDNEYDTTIWYKAIKPHSKAKAGKEIKNNIVTKPEHNVRIYAKIPCPAGYPLFFIPKRIYENLVATLETIRDEDRVLDEFLELTKNGRGYVYLDESWGDETEKQVHLLEVLYLIDRYTIQHSRSGEGILVEHVAELYTLLRNLYDVMSYEDESIIDNITPSIEDFMTLENKNSEIDINNYTLSELHLASGYRIQQAVLKLQWEAFTFSALSTGGKTDWNKSEQYPLVFADMFDTCIEFFKSLTSALNNFKDVIKVQTPENLNKINELLEQIEKLKTSEQQLADVQRALNKKMKELTEEELPALEREEKKLTAKKTEILGKIATKQRELTELQKG